MKQIIQLAIQRLKDFNDYIVEEDTLDNLPEAIGLHPDHFVYYNDAIETFDGKDGVFEALDWIFSHYDGAECLSPHEISDPVAVANYLLMEITMDLGYRFVNWMHKSGLYDEVPLKEREGIEEYIQMFLVSDDFINCPIGKKLKS